MGECQHAPIPLHVGWEALTTEANFNQDDMLWKDKYLVFQSYPDCLKQLDAGVPVDGLKCILYTKFCLNGISQKS